MPSAGSCLAIDPAALGSGGGGGGGSISIAKPVGQGGAARNLPDDVRTIQDALNQLTAKGIRGGPMPPLDVDGLCGPKTNAAILKFQREQVPGVSDGLIEPGKNTILRLNELLDPVSRADMEAKVRAAMPFVNRSLNGALTNLTAIISQGPGPGASDLAADRLNRHFKLGSLSADRQSTARISLFRTYTRMAATVQKPELFDMAATDNFDVDKSNAKIALTRGGGFFEEGQTDPDGRRLDQIQLGFGFFARNVTNEFAAFIIIHELAHFLNDADGNRIVDNGRGWFNDTFIVPLDAPARLTNADSYAGFSWECGANSSTKPPFVKTAPGGLGGAR
jgi:hypothetical protein